MNQLASNRTVSLQQWLKELKEFQLDSIFDNNILARAYLYTDSITVVNSAENIVESEVGLTSIYRIILNSTNGHIYGSCTCPFDGKCKHLAASILSQINSRK